MKVEEKNVSVKSKLTQNYSRDSIEALSKCVTHSDLFLVTGDMHVTSDNAFQSSKIWLRKLKVTDLKSDKSARLS